MVQENPSAEDFLHDKIKGKELEDKVSEKQKKFSGLLTREGALKLIAIDEGFAAKPFNQTVFLKISEAKQQQEFASFVARVKQINCALEFEREGRKGKVCNIIIADESGEAILVLWNDDVDFAERKIERNSCIRIENALVKNGEFHSNLYTGISLEQNPIAGLPDFSKPKIALSNIKEGDDFFARIAMKGKLTEFERDGEKRFVINLTVEDERGSKTLVCWNRNAVSANFLKEGDVLKVESVQVKNGELHASRQTHLVLHAKNHSLKELAFKPLAQLEEGVVFVNVVLEKLFEAR